MKARFSVFSTNMTKMWTALSFSSHTVVKTKFGRLGWGGGGGGALRHFLGKRVHPEFD